MKYSREVLLNALKDFEEITILQSSLENENGSIVYEWKGSTMLLSIPKKSDKFGIKNSSRLQSAFGIDFIFRPEDTLTKISTLDKYRISNYLTAKAENVCCIAYIESKDAFKVSAKYMQILENRPEYKLTKQEDNSETIRYILLYLMGMCLFSSADLAEMLEDFLDNDKDQSELLKDF
ncbi:hypothetical protein RIK65_14800 [Enterobacter asburiae]|uniref:hypothetical protein n=1 Tax=Enterobacter asburiae TaxID=61645 RepID=UPI00288BD4F6|nr:hypothetical protein [Enterobacter asburiae]WNI61399.1 hypothetical protein RIL73_12880 [Enterobacter asburiae]WNI66204.1 hypothetical protein RIK65_14800 [Enterobacter asburiae]